MVGRIMTAQQAVKEYGDKYKSIVKRGNEVTLKNTEGDKITVGKNEEVYHRGRGKFAPYSTADDKAIHSKYAKEKVGQGAYRQTHDKRRKTGRTSKRR